MFHINLKKRRLASGFSQKQVADYLNITPQSVSKWENGDSLPSIEYLPKLAEFLNCDINAFFEAISEITIDNSVMYEFLALMNDNIYHGIRTMDDIAVFENTHPGSIAATKTFCEALSKHKTITQKVLQRTLGCSETEVRLFIKELIVGEMLEELDIDDTYLVQKDAIRGFLILLSLNESYYEKMHDKNNDIKESFYSKIDILKSKGF